MHDGVERCLHNTTYIPNLKRNLMSLGTLVSTGFCYKAEKGIIKVTRGCLVFERDNGK